MARWERCSVLVVAWLATSCLADGDAPQTQLSSEKLPTASTTKLLVVDPLGAPIGGRRAPDMRVYVDGILVRAERTGEFYVSNEATKKPYSVSVRFEASDRKQSLFFNWMGMTSPAPRIAVRNEVVPTQAVTANVRLVGAHGEPYNLATDRRLLFALEDPDVEIAYFSRSNWRPNEDGLIHLSALSMGVTAHHLEAPIHVLEMSEADQLPNVPQWIFATGSGSKGSDLVHTIVMKPTEEHVLVTPKVANASSPSSSSTTATINVMLRPPTLGMTRVQESTVFPPPLVPLPTIALAPPQSGLLTTVVAEAKLPGGGIGRAWQSNLSTSTTLEPFVIPEELTLIAPLDQATGVLRTDSFEWKPSSSSSSSSPNTIYKLTASCTSTVKGLYLETFTASTSVPINEAASYDCDWRVKTISASGMSIDTLATTNGWQARQFEENKFDSGSTSISATRHFSKR